MSSACELNALLGGEILGTGCFLELDFCCCASKSRDLIKESNVSLDVTVANFLRNQSGGNKASCFIYCLDAVIMTFKILSLVWAQRIWHLKSLLLIACNIWDDGTEPYTHYRPVDKSASSNWKCRKNNWDWRKYWADIYFDLFEYCSGIIINL